MYSVPYFDASENYHCRTFKSPNKALQFFFYISGLKFTAMLYVNKRRVFITENLELPNAKQN